MRRAEDDLRAALRSLERHAPDPGTILQCIPRSAGNSSGRPGRRTRTGWLRVVAPLSAAAAVIAVIAASLAITGGSEHAPGPGPGPESPAARAAALASVPPYYVALTGFVGQRAAAVIRASVTGDVLATVTPPSPYGTFTHVAGAADDRTFVLAAQRWAPIRPGRKGAAARQLDNSAMTKFFLLRFGLAARSPRLRALPVPGVPGGDVSGARSGLAGIAISPDGSKLAILLDRPAPASPQIKVASVATGSEKTWAWQGPGWIDDYRETAQPLSWAADGRTLAFQQGRGNYTTGVRLLDTTARAGNLRSASRLAAEWHFAGDQAGDIAITPDGTKIIAPVTAFLRHPLRSDLQIAEFSAITGKVLRVAGHWHYPGTAGGQDVRWTNRSGSTLIVVAPDTSPFEHAYLRDPQWAIGVLTGGQFTPLPQAFAHDTRELAW